MNRLAGIRKLAERVGSGDAVRRGDTVAFRSQVFLNRGDCIQAAASGTTRIGSRQIIAGVEYALIGMRVGGYRRVKISPHLAYRQEGVADRIPAQAVLMVELWLDEIVSRGEACETRFDDPEHPTTIAPT